MDYYMCMATNWFSRPTHSSRGTSHFHRLKHEPIPPTTHMSTLFSSVPLRGLRNLWSRSLFVRLPASPPLVSGDMFAPPAFIIIIIIDRKSRASEGQKIGVGRFRPHCYARLHTTPRRGGPLAQLTSPNKLGDAQLRREPTACLLIFR